MTWKLALAALLIMVCAVRPAVAQSCTAYASGIAFGTYSQGTNDDVTGTVTVTCTNGTAYHIGLNAGIAPGATVTNRMLTGGSGGQGSMTYQLFSDAGRSTNWGNTSGTNWVAGVGTGSAQVFTVYARIPGTDFGVLGNFSDTVTASITGSFTTVTATWGEGATVVAGCGISATSLAFPNYSGSAVQSTSTVTVTCTDTTPYTVGLNAGTWGASVTTRKMKNGAAFLNYALYSDSSRTVNWGNTAGSWVSGTGNGSPQGLTVYGQVAAGQHVAPASYTDTITATVTY
jgi:spore coat protein U-like protein